MHLPHRRALLLFLLILPVCLYAQQPVAILPVSNPSHLQLKVVSGNRVLTKSRFLTAKDSKIDLTAYSETNDELIIPKFSVDIVRGGRKIATETMSASSDLRSLFSLARANDIFRFVVDKIFIRNEQNELELYTAGTLSLVYEYKE